MLSPFTNLEQTEYNASHGAYTHYETMDKITN